MGNHPSSSIGSTSRRLFVNGAQSGPIDGPYVDTKTWTNSRSDAKLPDWRARIRQHSSATTTVSGFRWNFSYGEGSAELQWNTGWDPVAGKWAQKNRQVSTGFRDIIDYQFSPGDPSGLSSSSALLAANTKLLQQIRDHYRQISGGTVLGELAETIRMIKRPAAALRAGIGMYHSTVKKRLRGARLNSPNARQVVSGTWLEYVFGWKPLINDVEDSMKALAYRDWRKVLPLSASGESKSASSFTTTNGYGAHFTYCEWETSSQVSVRIKGEMDATPASTDVGDLSRWGFGSWKELVPTVWELIPYSFLVDYFTNIGDLCESYATQRANVLWLNRSIRKTNKRILVRAATDEKATKQGLGTESGLQRFQSAFVTYSGYSNEITRFSRDAPPVPSLGLSDFSFRIPGVGSSKWLNIAALAGLRR